MKWFIASDIHGSAYYCRQLLDAFERENCDRILFLGDILYHGPRNDLPEGYAPKEVIAMLNEKSDLIISVRGNCDAEVEQMVLKFPVTSDMAMLCVNERTVFCTHGHIYNLKNLPPMKKGDVLLHGHTHVSCKTEQDGIFYLNPGSVSIPKENTPRGYMTLENNLFIWKTLDGTEYDRFEI